MYFDGRYKLCVYHDADTGALFDHETDPDAHVDLWDDPARQNLRYRLMQQDFNVMMQRSGMGPTQVADY